MEVYNSKVKKCGNIFRVHKYEKPVVRGYKSNRGNVKLVNSNISEEERERRRIKKILKSRNDFIDIVNHNFTTNDTFITLTYEREDDPNEIKKNFDKFIKKIKYRFGKSIKYCYIKYKQQRGLYHYHIVMDIDYIDKKNLDNMWEHGRSQISRIKNVNAIATYMGNHIDINNIEKKEYKEKIFQKSRTCDVPQWTYGEEAENILNTISSEYKEKFYRKYDTEMYGEMDIIIYEKQTHKITYFMLKNEKYRHFNVYEVYGQLKQSVYTLKLGFLVMKIRKIYFKMCEIN